jgi:hypothetical protein
MAAAQAGERAGKAGIDFQCRLVGRLGVLELILLRQRHAEPAPCLGVTRAHGERLAQTGLGLLGFVILLQQYASETIACVRVAGFQRQRMAVGVGGFVELLAFFQRVAEVVPGLVVSGHLPQQFAQGGDGGIGVARCLLRGGEVVVVLRFLGVEFDGLFQPAHGFASTAAVDFQHAQHVDDAGVARAGGERLAVERFGFVEAAGLVLPHPGFHQARDGQGRRTGNPRRARRATTVLEFLAAATWTRIITPRHVQRPRYGKRALSRKNHCRAKKGRGRKKTGVRRRPFDGLPILAG